MNVIKTRAFSPFEKNHLYLGRFSIRGYKGRVTVKREPLKMEKKGSKMDNLVLDICKLIKREVALACGGHLL